MWLYHRFCLSFRDVEDLLADLDQFIDDVITLMENEDDNIRFFDHRREDARTDWERGGLPNEDGVVELERSSASRQLLGRDGLQVVIQGVGRDPSRHHHHRQNHTGVRDAVRRGV